MTLLTVGDVARHFGVPRAKIDYALDKSGIRERSRAGILRLFGEDQLPVIQAALRTVKSRRKDGSPSTSGEADGGENKP